MYDDLTPAKDSYHEKSVMTQWSIALFCLFLIVGFVGWNTFSPQKWEYKIESVSDLNFTGSMNLLGQDGWEAVSARRASSGGDTPGEKPVFSYEIIFKRRATLWR